MTRLRIFYSRGICSAVAAGILLSAMPAASQEQTQESAVRFLNLFASQQKPPAGTTTRFDQLDPTYRLQLAVPDTKWVGATMYDPKEPCITDTKDSNGKTGFLEWDKVEVYFWPRSSWSEALLASDYGPLVKPMIEVRRLDKTFSHVFWPANEEQGSRLFKAMLYLKNSCDPMKKTGF